MLQQDINELHENSQTSKSKFSELATYTSSVDGFRFINTTHDLKTFKTVQLKQKKRKRTLQVFSLLIDDRLRSLGRKCRIFSLVICVHIYRVQKYVNLFRKYTSVCTKTSDAERVVIRSNK